MLFVAGVTDALDGLIARRAGQKTTLGAWLDPMADKLLLTSAFIVLTVPRHDARQPDAAVAHGHHPEPRHAIVTPLRSSISPSGPAPSSPRLWARLPPALYVATALIFMMFNYLEMHSPILDVFVYASAAITIVSSLHYITHAARIVNHADEVCMAPAEVR